MNLSSTDKPGLGLFYLLLVSVFWAFSFGLIKTFLSGFPPPLLAFLRLSIAFLVFLPWMQWQLPVRSHYRFYLVLGAVQYGLMYCLLFSALRILQAHEVVLFTLMTPVYVTLLGDLLAGRGLHARYLAAALLAILGAAVIKYEGLDSPEWFLGFLIMQGAGFCFAFGQVKYRLFKRDNPGIRDHRIYGWIFLGGTLLAGIYAAAESSAPEAWSAPAAAVILYLGIIASGLGFYLWNRGAALVKNTAVLAACNNVSIPLGVLAAVFVFGERTDWIRLIAGGIIIAAAVALALRDKQSD